MDGSSAIKSLGTTELLRSTHKQLISIHSVECKISFSTQEFVYQIVLMYFV